MFSYASILNIFKNIDILFKRYRFYDGVICR